MTLPMDAFWSAIRQGDLETIEGMLRHDPNLVTAESNGVSAVMLAMYVGKVDIAQRIAAMHPGLNLFEAAVMGDVAAIQRHLDADPGSIDRHSPDGFTALGFAAYFGRLEAVAKLLERGANPNVPSTNALGVAPLHSALAGGQSAIAMLLLKGGADPNLQNAEGWTALHYCADIGDAEIAELILERDVDHSLRNRDGRTAAELAADVGHDHVAEVILEAIVAE